MFVTNNDDLYEKVLTLSNHGRARGQTKQFWPDMVGFKYKMSNIQAAIGCAQMERIEELIAGRRKIFSAYQDGLRNIEAISMNPEPDGTQNGYWMPTVVFDEATGITREKLQASFKAENADARVFFWPLSQMEFFESAHNPVASSLPGRAINLPSHQELSDTDQRRVVEVLRGLLRDR
jgi:perosamine synthetase